MIKQPRKVVWYEPTAKLLVLFCIVPVQRALLSIGFRVGTVLNHGAHLYTPSTVLILSVYPSSPVTYILGSSPVTYILGSWAVNNIGILQRPTNSCLSYW